MNLRRIEQLKAFIAQDPNDPFPRYALALEQAASGDTAAAVQALEELLMLAPRYVPPYQQLGYLYQKQGLTAKARTTFEIGIRIAREEGDHHAASEMQESLDETNP